jgi:hypothetical protein
MKLVIYLQSVRPIREVKESHVELKQNGKNQLLICADDIHLLGDIKYNNERLDADKEVGPEVNAERSRYVLTSLHWNSGKNHNINISNRSLEHVSQFKYLGTMLTNLNGTHEKINSRLNSSNVCYNSVQNLLSYRLLSANVKIKIYKTAVLPTILCGCEAYTLILREEHRLRASENSVLRRIFGSKKDKVI